MNSKNLLSNLVNNELREHCRLVLVYGSYSKKMHKLPTKDSDIDFLIIYTKNANPYRLSHIIETYFREKSVRYDYAWYEEEDFISLLKKGVDFLFFKNIFSQGEILYADKKYLRRVKNILSTLTPIEAFVPSIKSREIEIIQNSFDIIRDLHVMLIYCLWTKYWLLKKEIPPYEKLISILWKEKLIDEQTYSLCKDFEIIKKRFKRGDITLIRKIPELYEKVHSIMNSIYQMFMDDRPD